MRLAAILLLASTLAACHRGEDHPLYEWEMVIPYSPKVKYPDGYPIRAPSRGTIRSRSAGRIGRSAFAVSQSGSMEAVVNTENPQGRRWPIFNCCARPHGAYQPCRTAKRSRRKRKSGMAPLSVFWHGARKPRPGCDRGTCGAGGWTQRRRVAD